MHLGVQKENRLSCSSRKDGLRREYLCLLYFRVLV